MTTASHVYIALLTNEQRLKIGKADVVVRRLKDLKLIESMNPAQSWQVRCPSARETQAFERLLQARLDPYRLRDLPATDGYTEWFDSNGYAAIMDLVRQCAATLGYTIEPLMSLRDSTKPQSAAVPRKRTIPVRVSLKPLRPWIEITRQYPHTLSYELDADGTLRLYLEARGQDALDIQQLFARQSGIEPPHIQIQRKSLPKHQDYLFGDTDIVQRYNSDPPTLQIRIVISAIVMKIYHPVQQETMALVGSRARTRVLKHVARWIHELLLRPEIPQLTDDEAKCRKEHYHSRIVNNELSMALAEEVLMACRLE